MKRKIRKRVITKRLQKESKEKLEKETKKLVGKANARLRSLERRYKRGTWASKLLRNKLSSYKVKAWTKGGRVKLKSNLTNTQLIAINKAINSFLKSKTATKQGIEEVKREQIDNIKARLGNEEVENMTDEEAEFFYEMFGEYDYERLADLVGDSALQACIQESIVQNDTEDQFIQRLQWYSGLDFQDLDKRELAIKVYNKYVLGR